MALQIDVNLVEVAVDGDGGKLTINLKCWEAGADIQTDEPVIDMDKSALIKKGVEGLTKQALVNRATTEIGEQFQAEIDRYKQEQTVGGLVNITALQNGLAG
jgi:hypothetical protein